MKSKRKRSYRKQRYRLYYEESKRECYWCKTPLKFEETTADHIVDLADGGTNLADNIVIACSKCNHNRCLKSRWTRGFPEIAKKLVKIIQDKSMFRWSKYRNVIGYILTKMDDGIALTEELCIEALREHQKGSYWRQHFPEGMKSMESWNGRDSQKTSL